MPYTKDNPPDKIKGLPGHAQEIWISAFNNALKEYDGDEGKATATAWSAVEKAGYKKGKDDKWIKEEVITEDIARRSNRTYSIQLNETRNSKCVALLEEKEDALICEVDVINLESPTVPKRGWSLNRNYYTDKALEGLARVMKNRRMMGTGQHDGGKLEDISGLLKESWKVPGQKIVKGKARIFTEGKPLIKALIKEQIETPDSNLISLSINADGKYSWGKVDGVDGRIVEEINQANSLDMVFDPGAGGSFKKITEKFNRSKTMDLKELKLERPDLVEQIQKETLTETEKKEKELNEAKKKVEDELTKLKEEKLKAETKVLAEKLLKESKLDEKQAKGLLEILIGKSEDEMKKLIEERKEFLRGLAKELKITELSFDKKEGDKDKEVKITETQEKVWTSQGFTKEEQLKLAKGEPVREVKK